MAVTDLLQAGSKILRLLPELERDGHENVVRHIRNYIAATYVERVTLLRVIHLDENQPDASLYEAAWKGIPS